MPYRNAELSPVSPLQNIFECTGKRHDYRINKRNHQRHIPVNCRAVGIVNPMPEPIRQKGTQPEGTPDQQS